MLPDRSPEPNPFFEPSFTREDFFKTPLGKKIPKGADYETSSNILSKKKTLYSNMLEEINYHKKQVAINPFYSTHPGHIRTFSLKIRKTQTRKPRKGTRIQEEESSLNTTVYTETPSSKTQVYRVIWEAVPIDGNFPEAREGATMNIINNSIILFGGLSCRLNHTIYTHSLTTNYWNKILTSDIEPRYGHSALTSGNNIIVFAGGTQPDVSIKGRQCLNTVKILRTSIMQWQLLITHGAVLQTRRYHVAALIGKHMFIHGGLNDKNSVLDDAALLNLERNKWRVLDFQGDVPGNLAFHTLSPVYPSENLTNPLINLFNINKIVPYAQSRYNIKEPGLYMFGGLTSDGTPTNILRILRAGSRPLKWTIPTVSGLAPSPRYMHSMTYFQDANILVVYGGRTDKAGEVSNVSYEDLHILNLESMYWAKVEVYGNIPDSRSSHGSAGSGSCLYVFGGISNGSFCNNQMFCLELEQKAAERKIRILHKQKRERRKETVFQNKSVVVHGNESPASSSEVCKSLPPLAPDLTRILVKTLPNVKPAQFLNKSRKAESQPNFKI